MYCPKCGTENKEIAKYCMHCGEPLVAGLKRPPHQEGYFAKPQISKSAVAVICELAGIVVCAIVLLSFIAGMFKPETVAKKYFVAMVNADYDKAFDLLNLQKTEAINEDSFNAFADGFSFGNVTDYSVIEQSTQSDDYYFMSHYDESDVEYDSSNYRNYQVEYFVDGDSYPQTWNISLVKRGKKYLFFDDWRINTEGMVATDFDLAVPQGVTVEIDGDELSKDYISTDDTDDYSYAGCDRYVVPEMFTGIHEVSLSGDDIKSVKRSIEVYDGGGEDLSSGYEYTDEAEEAIQKKAVENMEAIYLAAMQKKDFSTIEDLFSKESRDEVADDYDSLVNYFSRDSSPTSIAFSDVEATSESTSTDAEINFHYTITYNYEDWWDGTVSQETYTSYDYLEISFSKEDGDWLQTNLVCISLYY